jgi:pimeloyl-ACP methyl ester carboxylesterase
VDNDGGRTLARPIARSVAILVASALLGLLAPPVAGAQPGEQGCGQQPGNRFFWIERAFCDLLANGPERASGIVIWNHGISGNTESWKAPAPPVLRLLQAHGWDVIMLKRHHQAEGNDALYRTVQRTLEEAAASRKLGYRKVVLAGQSFGGWVTLDAVDTSPDIDAAIAFAPGSRSSGATGRLDASITDRTLQRLKVGRLALLFPKDDALFNYSVRGPNAQAILSRRALPYLLLDETSGFSGHGAGVTGRFALRHGPCLLEFLAATSLPAGRFTCPPAGDDWLVVRELLLPSIGQPPSFVRDASALPDPVRSLMGPRWAVLADSVVLVGFVDEGPGRLRLMYRSTGFGAGVFDAVVKDGLVRATLSNGSTVSLKPDGGGAITWTASDGSRSLDAPLVRGRDDL